MCTTKEVKTAKTTYVEIYEVGSNKWKDLVWLANGQSTKGSAMPIQAGFTIYH